MEKIMTLEEFCETYGYSQSSVKTNFKRTAAAFKKKYGKELIRQKQLKDGYIIKENSTFILYEEIKKLLGRQILTDDNFKFFIIEGILTSPFAAFRGTKKDFLNHIGIEVNQNNLLKLKNLLDELKLKKYINYNVDEDVFIIFPKNNELYQLKLKDIVQTCKEIVRKNHNNKDKFFQLIIVWIIMYYCFYGKGLSYENISYLTGLSKAQIRNVKDLLLTNENFNFTFLGRYLKERKGKF